MKKKMTSTAKLLTTVLLLAAVLFCGAAAGEELATLTVVVLDAIDSQTPVENVLVTIVSDDGLYNLKLKTPTSGDGSVVTPPLPTDKKYTITVSKDGYITQTRQESLTTEDKAISFYLAQESPILLKVVDKDGNAIPNAEITINSVVAGTTDSFGRLSVPMTKGSNNIISVKANTYLPFTETRYIASGETAVTIPLSVSETTPLFLIYNEAKSPVANAKISIDEKVVSYSDSYGRAQLPTYTTGIKHTVSVSCSGYGEYTGEMTFTSDKTDIVITLPYAVAPIKVTVKSENKLLPGSLVYFNGTNKGQTGNDGTYTTSENPGKSFYITAFADGYSGDGVVCTVEADKTNEVTILMKESIPTTIIGIGALAIIVILLIVIIIISGHKRNKTSPRPKKSFAPKQKRDSL